MKFLTLLVTMVSLSTVILAQGNLPEEYSKLPGKWKISKVMKIESEEDITEDYLTKENKGEPWEMELKEDGKMTLTKNIMGFGNATWDYLPEDEREKSPYIDFVITIYDLGGMEMSTDYYTLVSVDEEKLIFQNEALDRKWIYTRQK